MVALSAVLWEQRSAESREMPTAEAMVGTRVVCSDMLTVAPLVARLAVLMVPCWAGTKAVLLVVHLAGSKEQRKVAYLAAQKVGAMA